MRETLDYIKSCVETLAKVIEVPANLLPTYSNSQDGHPNVEVSDNGDLSYQIYERGHEVKIEYAVDLDHLLYLIFRDVTFSMALDYSSKNQQADTDYRRMLFQKQLELLGNLKQEWQQKEKEHQDSIALQFPFTDYEGKRQTYLRELMGNGFLIKEASEIAKQKFP